MDGSLIDGLFFEQLITHRFNRGFLFLDQGIKLGNFFGVITLFVLSKKKQISFIGGTPAMKKQSIFLSNLFS